MAIRFITDFPALFISDKKILVIADLHIGIEHEFYKSGIVIPPQVEKFQKTINRLIELTGAKTLVVLGDVKHEVPGISYREIREIPRLFSFLIEKIKTCVCLGNHDSFLKDLLPKEVKIYSSRGFRVDRYGFFHGHAWPSKELMQCDYLFFAHIHPVVEFKDEFGYRNIEQVWVRGKLEEKLVRRKYDTNKVGKLQVIIIPAFNRLLGGVALNRVLKEELIGPLIVNKFLELSQAKAYLLDGTLLGKIGNLERI